MSDNPPNSDALQPESPLGQIDQICDRFEAAWKSGERPRIEEYLPLGSASEEPEVHRQLLVELVMIDLEYRWRLAAQEAADPTEATQPVDQGASDEAPPAASPARPRLQDYLARYPELGPLEDPANELVDHECRVRERWSDQALLQGPNSVADGVGEFKGTERFVVERRIGAGGMGVVYRAYDRERKQIVAIKTVRNVEARAIYRLKQEFRALADLVHPNLVSLHELFSVGGQWFFTMEFVEGVDFLSYVRSGMQEGDADRPAGDQCDSGSTERIRVVPAGKLSTLGVERAEVDTQKSLSPSSKERDGHEEPAVRPPLSPTQLTRLRTALEQVAEGVFNLHQAGKLHRDVKPSNVLVAHDGRVVLLDFGLTTELERRDHTATTGYNVVGSVPYMSPEQAAGERLSPASDWYSMGVMLYEALSGRQPFCGRALDVLTSKQEKDPPPPSELVAGVPQDLNWLCMALLRRNAAARPSGAEVLRRLGSGSAGQETPPESRAPSLGRTTFVGREEQLSTLSDAFRVMKHGRAVVGYVHGRSGVGKTAFVQRFLDQVREREDTVILAGRCYECESVPYKALDSLVDALSHYLVRLPRLEVEALLPRDVEALSRAFPVLRRVEAVAQAHGYGYDPPDRHELRQRAFDGLRELLARLGDRKALVLHIDDLQWGDLDSVALLSDLLRPPHPPVLLLVLCYRSEEKATSPMLQAILELQAATSRCVDVCEIGVDPLTRQEARQLACALISANGPGAESLGEAIALESGGNPYFVEALVRHQQAGPPLPNGSLPTKPASLHEVLWARVSSLPEAARRLLEVVAVAGHPLRLADACRAAELPTGCHEALGALRATHMVQTAGDRLEDEIEAYDERIRETVVSYLTPQTAVGYHQRLAAALEASGQADPAVVAAHYVGGESSKEAGKWYAVAAAQAADALAFDRAAGLYQLALELRPRAGAEERDFRGQLADALANAGRDAEAAREYLAAARLASPVEALELRRSAAMQFLTSGQIDEGLAVLRTVLATVGLRFPKTPRRALWSLILRRLKIRLRGLRFRRRDESRIPAEELSRIDICWSAAAGLSIVDPVCGAGFQAKNLLLSLRSGEPYRIARAMALQVAHTAFPGGRTRRRVQRLLDRAEALAHQVNKPHVIGLVSMAAGIAACLQGRWKEAAALCDRAEQVFRDQCTGVAWERGATQTYALSALFWSGQIAELAERLPLALPEAQERGGATSLARLSTLTLPQLAANDPDGAEDDLRNRVAQWPQPRLHVWHFHELYARVQIDLYRGDGAMAWGRIEQQWPSLVRSLLLRVQLFRVMIHDARARAALAAATSAVDPKPFLHVAEQDARQLEREREAWVAPLAGLIRAGVAAFGGETLKAARLLEEAAARFDAVDMPLAAAAARRRLGELTNGEAGRALIEESNAWMAGQGIVVPAQMTALYAPGFPTYQPNA